MIPHRRDIEDLLLPVNSKGSPYNYVRLIEDFSFNGEEFIRLSIKKFLEDMDLNFRFSEGRTQNYYVKATRERTIITMFGEVTYRRTIYKDRICNKSYCYVDDKLGIEKYQRYGNDVASYAVEAYSDENSMIKVGIELGNLIYSKFSLADNRLNAIPRQTIYRLLRKSKEVRIIPDKEKKKIETLYVLMDEKYLPGHHKIDDKGNEKRSSKMTKTALVCEGLDKSDRKRHKYINPLYFSSFRSDFASDLISFINDRYDLEALKNVYVLADGANWIKAVADELKFPDTIMKQHLCRFHLHQALWRIFRKKETYDIAVDYVYHEDLDNLKKLFESIEEPTETIRKNIEYINSNWDLIDNTIHLKGMNCAMEQAVSHHIHSQFDNVPKVYGDDNLNRYLSFRDGYRNRENVKCMYIEGIIDMMTNRDGEKTIINKTRYDFSDVEALSSLPYYSTVLGSGKNPVIFKPHDDYRFIF